MTPMQQLTDRTALTRHRARASDTFLRDRIAADLQERLQEVNRPFTHPLIVTPTPAIWRDILPNAASIPDTDVLPVTESGHDLLIHDLSLHWANDLVGQLVQSRRALAPDGLFIGTLFGGQTLHELRTCLAEAESRLTGGLSPRVAPMAEIRDLGGLLQRAGFALPVADSDTIRISYADAFALMRDLRALGETNALHARLRRPTGRRVLQEAARLYTDHFADSHGRITATFEVVTLTGWAPADSQPQPLRPGSATARLADALGTAETQLKPLDD
ncbi:SAM-dependent methyltransferase [Loktanella sp. M215]|uniref:SAM-dependent methyltransferase n=1 Tax=Loktanella sp. M215 TaxID=2675431 RepID=UPI001F2096DB|nr:SAM-dependent methyltransferase [Loktanella sp. M215]MCF7698592.1 SAM-dependent methyltransferase [Loktanella sp. M215]